MARTGLEVGQVYRWTRDGVVERELVVSDVQGGFTTAIVHRWRGNAKMKGQRVMLPDDGRYVLVTK